jgi:hypothetical protein
VKPLAVSSDLDEVKQIAVSHLQEWIDEPEIGLSWWDEGSTICGYNDRGWAIDDVGIAYEIVSWTPYWTLAGDRTDSMRDKLPNLIPDTEWSS